MQDLVFQLRHLTQRNRDGSLKTQAQRWKDLRQSAQQLLARGYTIDVTQLHQRHVNYLVGVWKAQGLEAGTMANKLAHIRWWAEKIGKPYVVAPKNRSYGIVPRVLVSETSKAQTLTDEQLALVDDPWIQMSLRLVRAFGLRMKEALLLQPHRADGGHCLRILDNWGKNGRPREIVIVTQDQRDVLDAAKAFVPSPSSSLIPPDRQYKQQVHRYQAWTEKLGIRGHAVRHGWAQERYAGLSGQAAPHQGGRKRQEMTDEEQASDREARQQVSRELGHNRPGVVSTYIGSTR